MAWVGIDTGGTFTDAVVAHDGVVARGKSDSTHYDLTVGFFRALEAACQQLGTTPQQLLPEATEVVYSTTVGTNALVERKGPRLALLTTAGFETTHWVGRAKNWGDGLSTADKHNRIRGRRPAPLVPRDLIRGVRERIDNRGDVLMPLRDDDVREAVRQLVDNGARAICVVFLSSWINPTHEQRARDVIREEFPEEVLGFMPVLLSSEVSPQVDEYRRTNTVLIDALLRVSSEEHVVTLEQELKALGYRKPLLLAKCTGGKSSLSRTQPVHLFGSGPVAGMVGASRVAKALGIENVLVGDMGGTSFDVGLISQDESQHYHADPVIDRWRVQVPLVEHWSIGAGGGSIARVDAGGLLRVGPASAGAFPGPAAYGRGGTLPTVTDADLVLGVIDPNYFLGGRVLLDVDDARTAIEEHVAKPLGCSVDEAALAIKQTIDGVMAQEMHRICALRSGVDPSDFTLFAVGGAGPLHGPGLAAPNEISTIVTFPFGSVFGGFGTLSLGIVQTYDRSAYIPLLAPGGEVNGDFCDALKVAVDELHAGAVRDMAEEGVDLSSLTLTVELMMRFINQRQTLPIRVGLDALPESEQHVRELAITFAERYAQAFGEGTVYLDAGVEAIIVRLIAAGDPTAPGAEELTRAKEQGRPDGSPSTRPVLWDVGNRVDTPVYARSGLEEGFRCEGPALIEAADTVWAVAPGWALEIRGGGIGWMERSPHAPANSGYQRASEVKTYG